MKLWELEVYYDKVYIGSDGETYKFLRIGDKYEFVRFKDYSIFDKYTWSEVKDMEFQEYVDWKTVAVDTKILVSDGGKWFPRHFAYECDGKVYCWASGGTSWTSEGPNNTKGWLFGKLG